MKILVDIFRILADEHRLRLLMILDRKELCVCQLMGILGISQSLISHNLSILSRAGFLQNRKDGKLRFYGIKKDLDETQKGMLNFLRRTLRGNVAFENDLKTLDECTEFQKLTGRCDMRSFADFLSQRRDTK